MWWAWVIFLGIPLLLSAAYWVPQLIRNRKREPGKQTLFDYQMDSRAKAEMMIRQGQRDHNRTSRL